MRTEINVIFTIPSREREKLPSAPSSSSSTLFRVLASVRADLLTYRLHFCADDHDRCPAKPNLHLARGKHTAAAARRPATQPATQSDSQPERSASSISLSPPPVDTPAGTTTAVPPLPAASGGRWGCEELREAEREEDIAAAALDREAAGAGRAGRVREWQELVYYHGSSRPDRFHKVLTHRPNLRRLLAALLPARPAARAAVGGGEAATEGDGDSEVAPEDLAGLFASLPLLPGPHVHALRQAVLHDAAADAAWSLDTSPPPPSSSAMADDPRPPPPDSD